MFLTTVRAVKLEVRPLFLPQLVRLTAMLKPGLHTINVSLNYVCEHPEGVSPSCFIICHLLSNKIQLKFHNKSLCF